MRETLERRAVTGRLVRGSVTCLTGGEYCRQVVAVLEVDGKRQKMALLESPVKSPDNTIVEFNPARLEIELFSNQLKPSR